MSYWNCVYFLMVTMSTGGGCGFNLIVTNMLDLVGYGDIVCKTKMGRVLQLLSLLVGLVRIFLFLVIDFSFVLGGKSSEKFLLRLSLHPFSLRSLSCLGSRANGQGLIMAPKGRGTCACVCMLSSSVHPHVCNKTRSKHEFCLSPFLTAPSPASGHVCWLHP